MTVEINDKQANIIWTALNRYQAVHFSPQMKVEVEGIKMTFMKSVESNKKPTDVMEELRQCYRGML